MIDAVLKRIIDILFAAAILLVASPLFVLICIRIKLDSKGPMFYRGVRVGKHGRQFRMLKFRTMVVNADRIGGPSTSGDDPRITKIGRRLRRYNLDELPQFINVLKGDMSIVGPRPEVPQYVALFTEEEKTILTVRPGITDWATIWVRDEGAVLAGNVDPEKAYMEKIWPEKHRLELEYVRKHSIGVDIRIMAMTFKSHLIDRIFAKSANKAPKKSS